MRFLRSGVGPVSVSLFLLIAFVTVAVASSNAPPVELRSSGVVGPGRALDEATHGSKVTTQRWIVRMRSNPGWADRGALEGIGARVDTPLPGWAYLVSVPADRVASLTGLPRVKWAIPYLPQDKISPEIKNVAESGDLGRDVAVVLHLFSDADVRSLESELEANGLRVAAARGGSRFGRAVVLMTPAEIAAARDELARHNDVFWIDVRRPRKLANDNTIWVSQSGLDGGMTTPIFEQGLYGEGQIAAVLDTGLDVDMCYFRDDVNGLPPTNDDTGTTVDLDQRKVIAVNFLDPAEDPMNPNHWDTQGHGTHVTGTLAGDDLTTPLVHDQGDGMAPGARLVIQDAGYGADACGDLPGIGCPVTDLNPVFQQAYDQGARVHSNSWNDNENAQVQNNYSDASQDIDEFMWNNPDFLIAVAIGNRALGGVGTMGSPSTAKNCITSGGTYQSEFAYFLSDISAWGPTDDGRIKPDVLFPGASIQSALNDGDITTDNCGTGGSTGTSMTAPGVSGSALLIREYFQRGFYPTGLEVPANGFTPTAALLKAMLVNSGTEIEFDAEGREIYMAGNEQGWGRVLLDDTLHFSIDNRGLWVDDHAAGFTGPGDAPVIYMLEVLDASEPLKVTLAWTDYPSTPAASTHLVNDLDLRVDGPGGGWIGNDFFFGESWDQGADHDRLNNVEQVFVKVPEPGVYSIRISPWAIPSGPQPWSLVVSGKFTMAAGPRPGHYSHVIDDSGPNGNGDGVLDPGETATIPVTLFNSGDADADSTIARMHSAFPDLLKVYGDPISYGDINVGQTKGAAGPHYQVTLEPSATCGQILGLNLALSGNGFDVASGFTTSIGVDSVTYTSQDTPKSIPANSTAGVYSSVIVPTDHPYTEVDATINIDHQDISEFRVILLSPINSGLNLHRNTGAGVSGLHTTYDDETEPHGPGEMTDFLDLGPAGNWRIRVIDTVSGVPAGTIQNWQLHFKNDAPFACNPVSCNEGVPSAVGDTLMVARSGSNDVELDWTGVGGGLDYNVWRSTDPQLLTAEHAGSTGGTSFVDGGAQTLPGIHYYVVRSVNSCRWESP